MTATLTFKLVVLAIGLAASNPAKWAGSDETMAVLETFADPESGNDGICFRRGH